MDLRKCSTYSIVVPLFNEEESVDLLVAEVQKAVRNDRRFTELVLVDDGSRDATAELASKWTELDERVRLVRHTENRGLGAAIRTGLASSSGDFVLYTDADLPFDLGLIPKLIDEASTGHIVTGYRLNRGEGIKRLIMTKGYNFLVRSLFGLDLRDVNFACKVMPQAFVRSSRLISEGSFIDAEIMLESQRLRLTTLQFPLVYFPRERGCSTLSRPAVILGIMKEMFAYLRLRSIEQEESPTQIHNSRTARTALHLVKSLMS